MLSDQTDTPLPEHVQHSTIVLRAPICCLYSLPSTHLALQLQCPLEVGAFKNDMTST